MTQALEVAEYTRGRASVDALLFIFIFQNVYNCVSPYITLAVNVIVFLVAWQSRTSNYRAVSCSGLILALSFLILLWANGIWLIRGPAESSILPKYFRTAISTLSIISVVGYINVRPRPLVSIISFTLGIHVGCIGAQCLFPEITVPMAKFFGFTRESEIVAGYTMRKLGATGGYDTAAEFSVAAQILFYLRYKFSRRAIFLFWALLAFAATFASSRTGILLGMMVSVAAIWDLLTSSGFWARLVVLPVAIGGFAVLVRWLIPLFAVTFGIDGVDVADPSALTFFKGYGGKGTVEALTTSHLAALSMPALDLLFGYGIDPNSVSGIESDIGYVKLIYHVGIIGLCLILAMYARIVRLAWKVFMREPDSDLRSLSLFVVAYVFLDLVMNYKALTIYSRGSYELVLICFLLLFRAVERGQRHGVRRHASEELQHE